MANTPLAQVFRYNAWANRCIIDACRTLSDAQLDAHPLEGSGRSIRETLLHVATGQSDFLARLEGAAQDGSIRRTWEGFEFVAGLLDATSEALLAAALSLDTDGDVVVPYAGREPVFPKSFFLTHAAAHGGQHRTEIVVMLDLLGAGGPNLDGWEYAQAAGFGGEA